MNGAPPHTQVDLVHGDEALEFTGQVAGLEEEVAHEGGSLGGAAGLSESVAMGFLLTLDARANAR
jgi:hypothetical protein